MSILHIVPLQSYVGKRKLDVRVATPNSVDHFILQNKLADDLNDMVMNVLRLFSINPTSVFLAVTNQNVRTILALEMYCCQTKAHQNKILEFINFHYFSPSL